MKYRVPTVVVLESNDTYAHSAYGDSDIYVFQNDCLSRGLPDRDKEHVQEGFDHGALVLNRIIGKDIGLAPNARVIYVSSQSTGRGSFDRLKKLKSLLSYAQRHNMCIDAISISDTVSHVWRPELLLNETAAKQFGCLARSVLKMEPEDAEVKRLFDRFEQARKQASARNDYFLQDLREKEVQLRLDNLYRYVLKRSSDKYTNILFSLNILKDISVGHKNLMLSCEINNMLVKEQGAQRLWQEIQADAQKQGIAIFSVETCLEHKIGLHGINAIGKVFGDAEDERIHVRCDSDKTFLFPNGCMRVPDSYRGRDAYTEIARGGLSSLIPSMAGMFVRGRAMKPDLTMSQFLKFLKYSAGEKRFSSNGVYAGYVVNPREFDRGVLLDQEVCRLIQSKGSRG